MLNDRLIGADIPLLNYLIGHIGVHYSFTEKQTEIIIKRLAGMPIEVLRLQHTEAESIELLDLIEEAEKRFQRAFITSTEAKERYHLSRNQILADVQRLRIRPAEYYLNGRILHVSVVALERLYTEPTRKRREKD